MVRAGGIERTPPFGTGFGATADRDPARDADRASREAMGANFTRRFGIARARAPFAARNGSGTFLPELCEVIGRREQAIRKQERHHGKCSYCSGPVGRWRCCCRCDVWLRIL
jgi:hypothetical protein